MSLAFVWPRDITKDTMHSCGRLVNVDQKRILTRHTWK
jgi:hypothetical protein